MNSNSIHRAGSIGGGSMQGSFRGSIRWTASSSRWTLSGDVFGRSSRDEDDEEALKWAALEKLPTYDRMRKGIMREGDQGLEVNIHDLDVQDRKRLLERLVRTAEEDNERFLLKLRNRMERYESTQTIERRKKS